MQFIIALKIFNGHYHFELPPSFYPDYAKMGAKKGEYNFEFNCAMRVQSQTAISKVSLPEYAEIVE